MRLVYLHYQSICGLLKVLVLVVCLLTFSSTDTNSPLAYLLASIAMSVWDFSQEHPLRKVKLLTSVTVILTKALWNQVLPISTAVERAKLK